MKYNIQFLDRTDSTNARLREQLLTADLPEFTVVSTAYQDAGRGQQGNSWESEKSKNLLFSVYLASYFIPVKAQFIISQIASLSVAESLARFTEGVSIKWPNDIYWNQKKICGMLIEHNLSGLMLSQSIIGIGLNINQDHFVSDAPNPISLKNIIGKDLDCDEILNDILNRLANYYSQLKRGEFEEIVQRYHCSLFRKDGYHQYKDKTGCFLARIVRVESDGCFVLSTKDNEERGYLFKEVQVVL